MLYSIYISPRTVKLDNGDANIKRDVKYSSVAIGNYEEIVCGNKGEESSRVEYCCSGRQLEKERERERSAVSFVLFPEFDPRKS